MSPVSEFDRTLNHLSRLFDVDPCGAAFIMDRYQEIAATTASPAEIEAALNQACAEWQERQAHDPQPAA